MLNYRRGFIPGGTWFFTKKVKLWRIIKKLLCKDIFIFIDHFNHPGAYPLYWYIFTGPNPPARTAHVK